MQKKNIVALIQARMGSSRLPGKALLHFRGFPLIDWVVQRTKQSSLLDDIVVAIPEEADNDPLSMHLEHLGIRVFRGPQDDVLERFRRAAQQSNATHIVRICADNPLIWGGEIDSLIRWYFANPCDYAYNHVPKGNLYPDGLGAEMLSAALLEDIAKRATLPAHREHCLSFITDNPKLFQIRTFDPAEDWLKRPDIKLDIDTMQDYISLWNLPVSITSTPEEIVRMFPDTASSKG